MISAPASRATGPTGAPPAQSERKALTEAADAFEAVFLRQIVAAMRSTEFHADAGGAGPFRDMFDSRIADHLARSPGFTLSDALVDHFARHRQADR